jgi:hypothetical protein
MFFEIRCIGFTSWRSKFLGFIRSTLASHICSTDSIPWVHHSREEGSLDYNGRLVRLQVYLKFNTIIHRQQGGCCCSLWASCCCVWRIWHNTPVWAAMNGSTIILGGGGGGRSLPLLDAPKPLGELHVGPTIWKNWASIKYTFTSLFSQAEHYDEKPNWNKSLARGNTIF